MSQNTSKSKNRKLNTGVTIGIIAIVINVITVSVYMYQANIMQRQQHASAWPYLEWLLIYNQDEGLKLEVKNNGVGPAIIKNATFFLKGQPIVLDSLLSQVAGTSNFPRLTSVIENRVIPANGIIRPFQVKKIEWAERMYYGLVSEKMEFKICYESIYGEQWVSVGTQVKKGECMRSEQN
jgi:hypothetical protein